ncbi:MAG TPA: hypothetical protein V6D17_19065 [Candidatus Obscuribacterales bacterium]
MNDFKDYLVAGNPQSTINTLRNLSTAAKTLIRKRLAENPSTPLEVLDRLAQDANPEVRAFLAGNRATPEEILHQLSFDEHDDVRLALAEDPSTPMSILLRLTADENPYVSDSALRTVEGVAVEQQLLADGFTAKTEESEVFAKLLVEAGLVDESRMPTYLTESVIQARHVARILSQNRVLNRDVLVKALKLQALINRGKISRDGALEELRALAQRV